jgi:Phage integrase, N-terminal SAM-like domain
VALVGAGRRRHKRSDDGSRLPSKRHGRGKRWRVRWIRNQGNRREQLFDRKADAERHDANVHADISRGQYIDGRAGRRTVADLAVLWREAQLHTDSTAVRVEHALRVHVLPKLGHQQIGSVRPSHIQAWVKDRAGVLAPTTLRVVYTYLSAMFTLAVRDRMLAVSPCDRGIRLPPIERGVRVIPSQEQVHRLVR